MSEDKELRRKIDEAKAHYKTVAAFQKKINDTKKVRGQRGKITLAGRDIDIVIYEPKTAKKGTVFGAFGGGFVMGGCAMDDAQWDYVCNLLSCELISIGYRKAPESKFPCAHVDFYESIVYMCAHAKEYGIVTDDVWVYGSSAGANIAAGALQQDIMNGTGLINGQILMYPFMDPGTDPQVKGHSECDIPSYYVFRESYYAKDEWKNDPLAAPVLIGSKTASKMPKTIICVADADPLKKEGERYAELLRQNGVEVYLVHGENMPHGFVEFNFALNEPGGKQGYFPENAKEVFENGEMAAQTVKVLDFVKEHFN